jgi:hypothetical protein
MKTVRRLGVLLVALASAAAFGQESEFKAKMQEDLDGYKSQLESSCGIKPSIAWTGGKFGHNPRESEKPEWNALTTMATSALDAVAQACNNAVVKEKLAKVKKIEVKKGKGTLGYALKGDTLTLTVDVSFTDNNPAGQDSDLVEKLKKELDT